MKLTPGSRWMSPVCNTEVVVLKAPASDTALECGGTAMVAVGTARSAGASAAAAHGSGTLLGKRYADEDGTVEVLCTKGGEGSLSVGGKPLVLRATTPLPSSD
jgi:hypothetical protein